MSDKIKVVCQSTAEREQETRELFEACVPYLDKGIGLVNAIMIVKDIPYRHFYNMAWYKEVKAYAESQGYETRKIGGQGGLKPYARVHK